MPRQTLPIKAFEGGLNNKRSPKDIEQNQAANMVNAMVDELGIVRLMGGETLHAIAATDTEIVGTINPGYGLFSFPSDYDISGRRQDTGGRKLLALQNRDKIGIYDGDMHLNEIDLAHDRRTIDVAGGILGGVPDNVEPMFYYDTFSGLRACDSNITNNNHYGKLYKPIGKTWMYGDSNTAYNIPSDYDPTDIESTPEWISVNSYIFPPSVNASGSNTHQLYSTSSAIGLDVALEGDSNFQNGVGCIGIKVAASAQEDSGDFTPDAGVRFGVSFQYDDGQESTVSEFFHTQNTLTANTADHSLDIIMYANIGTGVFDSSNLVSNSFDPRIKGVNLYLTGVADGKYDDPEFLAFWDFGDSDVNKGSFTSHENISKTVITEDGSTAGLYYTEALTIKSIPALTYRLKNQVLEAYPETTAARYKTAVVSDQLVYIGGVQRYKFLEDTLSEDSFKNCSKQCSIYPLDANNDRILVSQPGKMDIFTPDSFIDVTANDGESVVVLKVYKDKLLLFKQDTLYVLNVSGEFVFVDSEHKHMGVSHPSKVTDTDYGVAWVNSNGCFIYTGEGIPISITEGKLKETAVQASSTGFSGWDVFGGGTSAIGYIPILKQLVIFKDLNASGDVMIYDLQTKSWAYGLDKIALGAKSNIVSNYDDSCMFLTNKIGTDSQVYVSDGLPETGTDAIWRIENLGGGISTSGTETKLKIGSTYIVGSAETGIQHGPYNESQFINRVQELINSNTQGNSEVVNADIVNGGLDLEIRRYKWNILSSAEPYSGNSLAWEGTTPIHYNNAAVVGPITTGDSTNGVACMLAGNSLNYPNQASYTGNIYQSIILLPAQFVSLQWIMYHISYRLSGALSDIGLAPISEVSQDGTSNIANLSTERSYLTFTRTGGGNFGESGVSTFTVNPGLYTGANGVGVFDWETDNVNGASSISMWEVYPILTGAANGDGSTGNPQTGVDFPAAPHSITDIKLDFPGVVFKKNQSTFSISIWGDHSSQFNTEKFYTISGTPNQLNDIASPGINFNSVEYFGGTDPIHGPMGFTLLTATGPDNTIIEIENSIVNSWYETQESVWQSFKPISNRDMTGFSFKVAGETGAQTFTAKLYSGEGVGGTLLKTGTNTFEQVTPNSWIDISLSPQTMVAGDTYTVEITTLKTEAEGGTTSLRWEGNNDFSYADGIVGIDGTTHDHIDMAFKIHVNDFAFSDLYTMSSGTDTITFVELDNDITIINSDNTGAIGVAKKDIIHIDRGSTGDVAETYWSITDHANETSSSSKIYPPEATPVTMALSIKNDIEALIDGGDDDVSEVGKWRAVELTSVISGSSSGNFQVIAVASKGTRFKIDKDLVGMGVRVGDSFKLAGTGLSSDYYYKLAALSVYGHDMSNAIDAGFTYGDIITVNQAAMDLTGTIKNDSGADITTNTNLSSVTMTYNTIELENQYEDLAQYWPLTVTASTTDAINISEFINTKGSSSTKAKNFEYTTKSYDMDNPGGHKKFISASITLTSSVPLLAVLIIDGSATNVLKTKGENSTTSLTGNKQSFDLIVDGSIPKFKNIAISIEGNSPYDEYTNVEIDSITIYYRSLNR